MYGIDRRTGTAPARPRRLRCPGDLVYLVYGRSVCFFPRQQVEVLTSQPACSELKA